MLLWVLHNIDYRKDLGDPCRIFHKIISIQRVDICMNKLILTHRDELKCNNVSFLFFKYNNKLNIIQFFLIKMKILIIMIINYIAHSYY